MTRRAFLLAGASGLGTAALGWALFRSGPSGAAQEVFPVARTDAEWRALLTPQQYAVLRDHGTEWAFTSPLNDEKRTGTFHCAGCDNALYSSETKFDSGTGWPSFNEALPGAVGTSVDSKLFMLRTEVHCARCGGHLGHIFDDGPPPTGKRHCINGVALVFKPAVA
jgi:peptide-methionine (R)-S-oxide reductase